MAKSKSRRGPRGLPSREELVRFIQEQPTPVAKRDIARAFGVKGQDRVALKGLLRQIEAEGLVARGKARKLADPDNLPEVTVIEVIGRDADGEMLARPVNLPTDAKVPVVYLAPDRRGTPALIKGERVLARLRRTGPNSYDARPLRLLGAAPARVLGVFEERDGGTGRVRPTDKRARHVYDIGRSERGPARDGDLVWVEPLGARTLAREARVLERVGRMEDPRGVSLVAIASHDIPVDFPKAALDQASAAGATPLGERRDLRGVPLVTIDGEDARDFDDAVFAEPDADKNNQGGWHVIVAIADVAWYVREGDALDREAWKRGNSVYFPDRVVPMLPEALSNGWCSLKPREERGCLAVDMWFDAEGNMRRHRFCRGLMRSAARLTYNRVQAAIDGKPDDEIGPLQGQVIGPLYGAFKALLAARQRRGAIDLDLPERKIVIGADGKVAEIVARERFDSHKLIEEFMIAANVAAAETLEKRNRPCMYRVHEPPDPVKVEALRQFLRTLDISFAAGAAPKPHDYVRALAQVGNAPHARMVHEMVLRSQSQAVYAPSNRGHFGLALARYAHFTSPIRRYSDLLVHRALISGLGLGEGGMADVAPADFAETGVHISATERRAAAAERDAADRYATLYLADRVGASFMGVINGVTRFGLFVTLDDSGADGLIPIRTLGDYFEHDEARHMLVGRATGQRFFLGDKVRIRLKEADTITGGMLFDLLEVTRSAADSMPAHAIGQARNRPHGKSARRGQPKGGVKHAKRRRR